MAFTGGGDVIGEATVQITPELDMAALQTAVQRMTTEFNRFAKSIGLQGATNQVNALSTATKNAGRSAQEARAQFVELAIGLEVAGRTLTQFVSVPVAKFIQSSVTEASHLNEVINQTKVIFGETATEVLNWAETLEASLGLSTTEALEANNNFARLFNEVGVGMEQSSEFAQALVERIGDLASFTDFPIEQVIQRVTSGLVGETEAVRRLGIILDETVIKQEAYNQGIVESGAVLNTEQKFLLRLQQILAQTSEAQGDAARTADTYAGQLRQMHRNTSELQKEVGQIFLPTFTRLASVFNGVLNSLTSMAEGFQELPGPVRAIGIGLTGLLVLVGPLTTAFGRLLIMWRTATTLTNGLTAAQARLTAALGANTFAAGLAARGFAALNRAIPGIAVAAGAFAVASLYVKDFMGSVEELKFSLEGLEDPTLRTAESFDRLFRFAPEDIIRVNDEIARLNQLIANTANAGDANRIRDLVESLEATKIESWNNALAGTRELLKQGALGAVEGAIANLQLANSTGQLNGLIAQMTSLLNQEIVARQRLAQEQQRTSELIHGIGDAARDATGGMDDLADAQEDYLKALKDVASELQQLASLERQRLDAIKAVTDAQKALNEANEDVIEAQEEYNQLVAEGVIDTERLARAEEQYADALERVADAEEALAEAQEKSSPEDLQEGLDNITKAEVAYRQVLRDNEQAVADLNEELEKNNKITRISLNLAGLSLDQMKGVAANARASAEALAQKASLTEDDNEVVKTAAELQDDAILRDIAEREALRDVNDAKEDYITLTEQGTEADEDVIAARENLAEATRDLAEAEEERRLAGLPDQARVEAIADANERVADAIERAHEATIDLRTAEQERVITLKDIAIEVAFIREDEEAINRALRDRFGVNAQLLAQTRLLREESNKGVQAMNAAEIANSFNFGGGLGGVLQRTKYFSQGFLDQLTNALVTSPGAPLRDILRRLGVPEQLFAHFREGGVVTAPTFAHMGEGYKAEAVVPLTNARNAIAALQKGWGYMAPQLKTALAPALAPRLTQQPQAGFSMTHGSYSRRATPELAALHAIASRLENQGTVTHIEAPIQINSKSDELQARKLRRELQKLQSANRGRPDARMR